MDEGCIDSRSTRDTAHGRAVVPELPELVGRCRENPLASVETFASARAATATWWQCVLHHVSLGGTYLPAKRFTPTAASVPQTTPHRTIEMVCHRMTALRDAPKETIAAEVIWLGSTN